ncbi:MAG TPA: 3'-5' exonuclease, partial [Arenimonas sp.]|nr:3'-5' exonuclease [Arenimonas sp.]
DQEAWSQQVERFHRLARHWRERGPLAVVVELLQQTGSRLLADGDGERALTDLRQLGELLQQQTERVVGPEQLLAWFAGQCEDGSDDDASEEAQLRIESDQQRVQLLTLHASKGLEFDLVFLPLMSLHGGREPRFASAIDGERRVVDLGTPAEAALRARAADEDQRERLRVLYVALTRARYYCHVLAMPPERPRAGSGKQPLGDPQRSALDRVLAQIGNTPDTTCCAAIEWRRGWDPVASRLARGSDARPGAPQVQAMPARRPWLASHSFSSLIHGGRAGQGEDEAAAIDEPAIDELPLPLVEEESPHPAVQSLSALRGTAFGNAVHAIFENREPSRPLLEQRELLLRCLRSAGVVLDPARSDGLLRELGRRLDACLLSDLGDGLRLQDIAPEGQRAEMAFHFELHGAGLDALRHVLVGHGHGDWLPESLGNRRLRGFMTGKIDLLLQHGGRVHVLDYKSNHLGERLVDYGSAALDAAMREHHYPLQALLYTVALDRYLRQRQRGYRREQHLGDAIYLFVRAAGLAPDVGIWRRRFDPCLIADLDAAFAIAEAQHA